MNQLGPLLLTVALLTTACHSSNGRVVTRANELAALVGDFAAADVMRWKVITSGVVVKDAAMYTLYGNDAAVQYARTNMERRYPPGSVLALVTWQRQEDARWFGAEIPARPRSVEVLHVGPVIAGGPVNEYRCYLGNPLREATVSQSEMDRGVARLLSLRAAVMP